MYTYVQSTAVATTPARREQDLGRDTQSPNELERRFASGAASKAKSQADCLLLTAGETTANPGPPLRAKGVLSIVSPSQTLVHEQEACPGQAHL